ncbi:nitrilase family protein [Aquimarina muelleri]|uniref:Omega-amidase YafV n=1 Tax=Aquimarina muelleri TaxID=279356 RepID=A0A918JSH2_9FLAO|nr:nitrilase family protein [Aquimarina muelleri]MCX2761614.1 nitrilase family protein [Aquimarina muelleri]GGX07559.1 amidohydrolase [Aquimarina muelleri]
MKETLEIALIQSHLAWENPVQNRAAFTQKINSITQKIDLIILPEMFTTGFTMNVNEMAETMTGDTVDWMRKMAKETDCAITGSVIIKEKENFYNRLVFMLPNGTCEIYDKHQLFTLAKEQEVFTAGQREVIVDFKGWKIKLLICYDLRFPVWARNTSGYDMLLYVASWPKPRINAWDALLKARAIENMSYCIGVNRIGLDGKGFEYNGHSNIYDVLGNTILKESPVEKETIIYATLDKFHIKSNRQKLSFLEDRDAFQLI